MDSESFITNDQVKNIISCLSNYRISRILCSIPSKTRELLFSQMHHMLTTGTKFLMTLLGLLCWIVEIISCGIVKTVVSPENVSITLWQKSMRSNEREAIFWAWQKTQFWATSIPLLYNKSQVDSLL